MSSVEIAALVEKKHQHVLRDIKNLIEQGAVGASNFGQSSYTSSQNKELPMFLLDFEATMTLITGYDAKRRSQVINRWLALERGKAKPAIINQKPASLLPVDREFRAAVRMAKAAGLKGNQAILSANALTQQMTGANCLELLGHTHLITEDQERILTATEIAQAIGFKSPQAVNKLLQEKGLQEKVGKRWVPTDAGKKFAVLLDTGKKHKESGAMVQQTKWKEPIVKYLVGEATA